jgi:hypothetical protein
MAENLGHSFTHRYSARKFDCTLIVLLSEAQWCFSAWGEAMMSNETTESDSERGVGSSLRDSDREITKIVSQSTEMVGHITDVVSEIGDEITEIVSDRKGVWEFLSC